MLSDSISESELDPQTLTIPVSNADSERGFSILRKINTDQRPSLSQETLIALMTLECCYE